VYGNRTWVSLIPKVSDFFPIQFECYSRLICPYRYPLSFPTTTPLLALNQGNHHPPSIISLLLHPHSPNPPAPPPITSLLPLPPFCITHFKHPTTSTALYTFCNLIPFFITSNSLVTLPPHRSLPSHSNPSYLTSHHPPPPNFLPPLVYPPSPKLFSLSFYTFKFNKIPTTHTPYSPSLLLSSPPSHPTLPLTLTFSCPPTLSLSSRENTHPHQVPSNL